MIDYNLDQCFPTNTNKMYMWLLCRVFVYLWIEFPAPQKWDVVMQTIIPALRGIPDSQKEEDQELKVIFCYLERSS